MQYGYFVFLFHIHGDSIHCEPIKTHQNVFCHIFYKGQSILIKFGAHCPE